MNQQGISGLFRAIAPSPVSLGRPTPGPESGKVEGRIERASTACKECRRHRTRCRNGQPCSECQRHGRECIIHQYSDKRRKTTQKEAQERLQYYRTFLAELLEMIRVSSSSELQHLVNMIRSGASQQEMRNMIANCLSRDWKPEPDDHLSGRIEMDPTGRDAEI
ncbi:uncharacterized protein N7473_004288 [Penicillium subrubescens]|uniref:uncharacterized protein n=1 Tax=Penicillium subrubescens TaxID=1316194 RepID=UPI002544F9B0|nr:uncharacterized protein N7473_004288 [Penicillium subrubescens]KAJ5900218.1 hypothetical protein N7473_004288 [Penicillium subrubescens]